MIYAHILTALDLKETFPSENIRLNREILVDVLRKWNELNAGTLIAGIDAWGRGYPEYIN